MAAAEGGFLAVPPAGDGMMAPPAVEDVAAEGVWGLAAPLPRRGACATLPPPDGDAADLKSPVELSAPFILLE